MKFLSSPFGALLLLACGFGLMFNPFTKFPYTMLLVSAFVLAVTYFQSRGFVGLGFRKFGIKELALVLLVFAGLELVMDFAVQPAINWLFDEPADYSAFSKLEGDTPKYLKYLGFMWLSAAFSEELFFRGFAFLQIERIFGKGDAVKIVASAVLFALPHLYQGATGLAVTFIFGLAFGAIYAKWKNIWINILVHGLVDSFFLTLAYLGMLSYFN